MERLRHVTWAGLTLAKLDVPIDSRRVEDPRVRELLWDLLSMVRQADGMGYKIDHFGAKLADENKHFEMAERWALMDVPEEWVSAFICREVYRGFQNRIAAPDEGEPSADDTNALLGFLDAEVGALRAHWTSSNSYLEGSMRALAEIKDAHIRLPEEDRPFLHDSVSQTRLDIFLISMSLIEFGLDNPANMRNWSEWTDDPFGDIPTPFWVGRRFEIVTRAAAPVRQTGAVVPLMAQVAAQMAEVAAEEATAVPNGN